MANDEDDRAGSGVLQELVRRRIFRSAGAYIVAGWVIVQAASIVFPEFNAPRWAMRAVIVMLIAGFPFAMLLAWVFDITSSGLVRTTDSHYSRTRARGLPIGILTVAILLSAGALWWVWTDYVQPSTDRPERTAIGEEPVVAVAAPRMLSGSQEIEWIGEGIANLVRSELADSPHIVLLSASGWSRIAKETGATDDMVEAARYAGIDYLVLGDYHEVPNGIVLNFRIEDLENRIELGGRRLDASDASHLMSQVSQISLRIRQALKIPLQENVERFSADFATQNMDAYEAYVAGLGFFVDFDFQQAERALHAAVELAPGYHMARFRYAEVLESQGRAEAARRELDRIPVDAVLTERERLYIDGAKALFFFERDVESAISIYRELVAKYPYDMEAGQLLADAYWADYNDAAAVAEFRRLARIHDYDPSAWMALGERLLDVGELDEAAGAIDRYLKAEPMDPYAHVLLGNLHLLNGDTDSSIAAYQRAQEIKPGFVTASIGLGRSYFLAGDTESAKRHWSQVLDSTETATQHRIDAAFDLVGVLRSERQPREAIGVLESIDSEIREEGVYTAYMLSTLGLLHLDLGEADSAERFIDQAILESPGPATRYLFARGLVELHNESLAALEQTATAIRAQAESAADGQQTEEKAADYLQGLAAVAANDLSAARAAFESASARSGYQYALYAVAHATCLAELGETQAALALLDSSLAHRDPNDLRLDLEMDRNRATELRKQLLQESN